ncbi:MAG: glycine zipper domain-containing protein [Limisphaerales bacterium]
MDAARLEEQYNRELEEMTDEIRAGIDSGKYTLSDIQRLVSKKSKEAATATDEFVRENPWAALGVAAAVGCLVGFLISRD